MCIWEVIMSFKLYGVHIYSGLFETTNPEKNREDSVAFKRPLGPFEWYCMLLGMSLGQMQPKSILITCIVHYMWTETSCTYACVCKLICIYRGINIWEEELGVKEPCSHIKSTTYSNNRPHRPDWLVHLIVVCYTPRGRPTQLSVSFCSRRQVSASRGNLSHTVCTAHIHIHMKVFIYWVRR